MKSEIEVALITGGSDKPYAFGLAAILLTKGVRLDFIGSDELDSPQWHGTPGLRFLNLRGCQRPDVRLVRKALRVGLYYVRLFRYAALARPRIFHILWNSRFELFDRTVLMLYYRLLRKRIVLTVHNVNAASRDFRDTPLNRVTLRIQYQLADHLFVHSEQMKGELVVQFGVRPSAITVIPFGMTHSVPETELTTPAARRRLGLTEKDKAILFFGRIVPYKGLEYLVDAFQMLVKEGGHYQLIISGRPDPEAEIYWQKVRTLIGHVIAPDRLVLRNERIADSEIEVFFKAADVLVLPYRQIYQSGVLVLAYRFGLPVIVTDVGSLKEDVIEGQTGFLCRPEDPADLARAIEAYFGSELYKDLSSRRRTIREYAERRYSWDTVSEMTMRVYEDLLRKRLLAERSTVASS